MPELPPPQGPVVLAAVAMTADGTVLGFTTEDACRAWIRGNDNWTVWTAGGFWRRERDQRAQEADGRHGEGPKR